MRAPIREVQVRGPDRLVAPLSGIAPALLMGRRIARSPFRRVGRATALCRLLGVQWLVRILHPRLFSEPLGPGVKAFHTLYYHRAPTDAQVRTLLDTARIDK